MGIKDDDELVLRMTKENSKSRQELFKIFYALSEFREYEHYGLVEGIKKALADLKRYKAENEILKAQLKLKEKCIYREL